ncbi:MAG: Gfo/Idh/MocA family oxidoreductase [Deltaproteobacteria bacterium]|jgi:UDP-2-acetamido-3-amino-2,3-dideoxy-glucuronate N-acetyltransferase|nr:Gfo/Idh/MocA family oxidoreductase [Deltaproteobacteria bacterium]
MNMNQDKTTPRVAVLGTGYWGKNLVRNFYDLGCLSMVADSNPQTLASILEKYPGIKGVSSLEEILREPGITAVVMATPAPDHARGAIQILNAGLDVMVEKPMALSMEDGRAMVSLARSQGRILMVDHLLNRHPAITHLKKMIREGEFGRICHIWSRRLNLGRLKAEENALWSLAPHDISLIMNLLGTTPLSVKASGGSYLTEGIVDMAEADLTFPAGITAHISVSWLNPFKEMRLAVVGLEKMAVFDDLAPWSDKLIIYPHRIIWRGLNPDSARGEPIKVELETTEPLKEQCQAFLKAITTRKRPLDSHSEEALHVLSVLTAMDMAYKEGRPQVPEPVEPGFASFVHPTAQVDSGVFLGPGSKVWHFSHIMEGSIVGSGCNIGQNVVIGPRAHIGNGCKIQNNVSVYEGVTLEDDVFCGPSMVFTNVNNPRSFIKRMHELRPTLVKRGATIGANATVVCGHTLGEYCFIAAGSVVTHDVPAYALMRGNPARRAGWICRCGEKLPENLECAACGNNYHEEDGQLTPG